MRPRLIVVVLAIMAGITSVGAQRPAAASGAVSGIVTDYSGAELLGATVTASSADGRVAASAVTDHDGRYRLDPLAPGAYTVTFELHSFSTRTEQIDVAAGATRALSMRLRVGMLDRAIVIHVRR